MSLFWSDRLKHQFFEIKDKQVHHIGQEPTLIVPCILSTHVLNNNAKCAIKIIKKKRNAIAVGICLENIVSARNFETSTKKGHGLYIMFSTQYTYSHHNPAQDLHFNGIEFGEGDII